MDSVNELVKSCRLLRIPIENIHDTQGSLGSFFSVLQLSFGGQQGVVRIIGYGWTQAMGIFMGN